MTKAKTQSGFEWEIDEAKLRKHKALRLTTRAQRGDGVAMEELLEYVLGEDGTDAIDEYCAGMAEDGEADTETVMAEFSQLIQSVSEGKN